jgi:hypothetical protein
MVGVTGELSAASGPGVAGGLRILGLYPLGGKSAQ